MLTPDPMLALAAELTDAQTITTSCRELRSKHLPARRLGWCWPRHGVRPLVAELG